MAQVSLQGCPRCGRNHDDLEAEGLIHPPYRFKRWAMCPVTSQPILLDDGGSA